MTNKPATESAVVQGVPKSLNPSRSVTRPPSVLQPATLPVSLLALAPVPGRLNLLFLLKSVKSVDKAQKPGRAIFLLLLIDKAQEPGRAIYTTLYIPGYTHHGRYPPTMYTPVHTRCTHRGPLLHG